MNCRFNNCNSTSGTTATQAYNGGAICVVGINTLIVSSSLFFNCRAPQTNHDNGGSGGIYTRSLKKSFSVSLSSFISCFTGSSGAGVSFDAPSDHKLDTEIVNDCYCLQCSSDGISPDGGGMCLWDTFYTMKCTGCLFSGCSTTGSGGGFCFRFGANSESYPIKFCFFADNTGKTGTDVCFYILYFDPCLHCFSTSAQNRVGYYDTTWTQSDFNWLLQ